MYVIAIGCTSKDFFHCVQKKILVDLKACVSIDKQERCLSCGHRCVKDSEICECCMDLPCDYVTLWIPLHDITWEQSPLLFVPRSHKMIGFYDVQSNVPVMYQQRSEVAWQTAQVKAGDVIFMNLKTIHAAASNQSDTIRIR